MGGNQQHNFHIVDPSPWPIVTSGGSLGLTMGAVGYFHAFIYGASVCVSGALTVINSCIVWWRDVIREGSFEGHHTIAVQGNLKLGMLFFIVSEVLFFSSFFWAFFHSSLAPTIELGGIWPPRGLAVLNAWEIPFLNTIILLFSGASITWAHHALILYFREQVWDAFLITIALAILFTLLQLSEYVEAPFTISDGVYGSTFFMGTGFHGFHVFIGTIFIIVGFFRFYNYHFSSTHHIGFESSAWYWHFVDVVWLFLFLSFYWWGNKIADFGFVGSSYSFS